MEQLPPTQHSKRERPRHRGDRTCNGFATPLTMFRRILYGPIARNTNDSMAR